MRILIIAFLLLNQAYAGEFFAQWTAPDIRENGDPFISGEYWGTRVTYFRNQGEIFSHDIQGESVRISGLKKGWWTIKAQSLSRCTIAEVQASLDFLSEELCVSEATPSLRVKVR